ncbi:MAG: hypothetical protein AAF962_01885 [Actinomycetota bacterium]
MIPVQPSEPPAGCTLPAAELPERLREWAALRGRAAEVVALDDGVRLRLPPAAAAEAEDLAERERTCCSFLDIATEVDDESVAVEIRSPDPAHRPIIDILIGTAEPTAG